MEVEENQENIFPNVTPEELCTIKEELMTEFEKVLELANLNPSVPTVARCMRTITCRLRNVRNPAQALTTLISISARSNVMRRGARINVQETATGRRREGAPRGKKCIAAGRPVERQPLSLKNRKRPHKLSLSISQNKSNPKAHGH